MKNKSQQIRCIILAVTLLISSMGNSLLAQYPTFSQYYDDKISKETWIILGVTLGIAILIPIGIYLNSHSRSKKKNQTSNIIRPILNLNSPNFSIASEKNCKNLKSFSYDPYTSFHSNKAQIISHELGKKKHSDFNYTSILTLNSQSIKIFPAIPPPLQKHPSYYSFTRSHDVCESFILDHPVPTFFLLTFLPVSSLSDINEIKFQHLY
jgi:hypothetical protein